MKNGHYSHEERNVFWFFELNIIRELLNELIREIENLSPKELKPLHGKKFSSALVEENKQFMRDKSRIYLEK